MLGRPEVGTVYRADSSGVRVVYRDGSVRRYAPFSLLRFDRQPLKIEGRMYPVARDGTPGYEAPALEPQRETKQ